MSNMIFMFAVILVIALGVIIPRSLSDNADKIEVIKSQDKNCVEIFVYHKPNQFVRLDNDNRLYLLEN